MGDRTVYIICICAHRQVGTYTHTGSEPQNTCQVQAFSRTAVNISVLLKFYFIPLKLLSVNNVQSSSNLIKMVHSE